MAQSEKQFSGSAELEAGKVPGLNDVMIAMDVVDVLRHDQRIAEQELGDDSRRAQLIKRLRQIYRDQGIEVSDRILEEGVKALEEERFTYDPPKDNWRRKLAVLYVTRANWGRWVLGMLFAAAVVGVSWYVIYQRPRALALEQSRVELNQLLPARMKTALAGIEKETKVAAVIERARQIHVDGIAAAKSGDVVKARESVKILEDMLNELRETYTIKIVTRQGELSGLWRIPRVNPAARNYYLIVEAVRPDGSVLPRTMVNEETGKRETVKTWALRVPKSVLERVQSDKGDDGIIQNTSIGAKARGVLEPTWYVEVSGGALTKW